MDDNKETLYLDTIPKHGNIFEVNEFRNYCNDNFLTGFDLVAHPSDGKHMNRQIKINPENLYSTIPDNATHVITFNI